jgi:thiopeptide-type bacteriocin biosynthesis protein
MVSVVAGTVVLRSRHLNRRVIPRLTSAHNYLGQSVGIYRFLCLLQGQGVAGSLAWDWGVLGAMPFLPRVTAGRIVLSLARWRAGRLELRRLGEARGVARVEAVRAWRAARRMPRWVALADADNLLPIDLENVLCIESFVHLVKGRDEATFLELVPGADEHGAHGPEGRFVHEIVVPFVRSTGAAAPRVTDTTDERGADERRNPAPSRAPGPAVRVFPPGSEWVYAKLYTGTVTADRVLREVVGPVSRAAERGGWIDRWFFIRYGDPDWHLRWRLRGSPERLREHVRPAIEAAVESALADGRLWRVVLDTYQPEVERYGGPGGIDLAEQVFHADSEAVLDVVDGLDGDAGADVRWRLALPGIDRLLADLGLDLRQRLAVIEHARAGFLQEWRAGRALKRQLSARFRTERRALEALLDGEAGASQTFAQGFTAFARRSDRLRPVAAELNARERASGVTTPLADLASSHVHMHVNRLLRSDQRAHELVLYDFLARLYRAALHRT